MTNDTDECRKAFEQEFEPRGYPMSHNGSTYTEERTEFAYRGFEAAWNDGKPKQLLASKPLPRYTGQITAAEGYRLRQDGEVVYHEPIPEEPAA